MAVLYLDARPAFDNPSCPTHPRVILPHMLTCPLCAQEGRRAAYARQRVEMAARVAEAVQRHPTHPHVADACASQRRCDAAD
jgi:hypothetical protein